MTDPITLQEAMREIKALPYYGRMQDGSGKHIDRDEVLAILARVANEEPR